jgi:DNA-binding transcriptional MocR family regulator
MTTKEIVWTPRLRRAEGPVFKEIADAIEADLRAGRLGTGDPLPTQRELAKHLGLNFTTITRAYDEAKRRGLVTARVGRGTFVASPSASRKAREPDLPGDTDLSVNTPPLPSWMEATLWNTLERLRRDAPTTQMLLGYESGQQADVAHDAGVTWLESRGLAASPERVVLTAGSQHALSVLLTTLARPRDVVLVEALGYPGLQGAAASRSVRLVGVELDGEGVRPDALEDACKKYKPKALFCVPTLQNPTTAVMSLKRRNAIVDIARKYRIRIVEDDICGPLLADAPAAFSAIAPDISFYIGSLSKCVAPGLRVAFVLLPTIEEAARLRAAVRASVLMLSPLPLSVASAWVTDGTANRAILDIRKEAIARGATLRKILSGFDVAAPAGSIHAWLRLPHPWTLASLVAQAHRARLRVAPADWYVMPSTPDGATPIPPAHIRVALGAEPDRAVFEAAIERLASILEHAPSHGPSSL